MFDRVNGKGRLINVHVIEMFMKKEEQMIKLMDIGLMFIVMETNTLDIEKMINKIDRKLKHNLMALNILNFICMKNIKIW